MKKYNTKIYSISLLGLTLIFGILSIFINAWWFSAIIGLMVIFVYIQNRSVNIDHYCVGVDLDTNKHGDVIEISVHAFNKDIKHYITIMTYFKQLSLYVNVNYLDNFYSNIGYTIIEDTDFCIRKVQNSTKAEIKEVKKFYKKMIIQFNSNYMYSAGSMADRNIEQPPIFLKKVGFGSRLWNWWTFK
jgi:hypothetical protein